MTKLRRAPGALAAAALTVAGLSACGPFGGGTISISAEFVDSVGLFPGNNVDVLGVPIGRVTTVTPHGTGVTVRMEVPDDVRIPADAGALIIPPSVITDRYVELTPVWKSGPTITAGAVIPLNRTRTPVEFDRIIRALDGLSNSLNADQKTVGAIRDALGVAAKNLDGNGRNINAGLSGLSAAVGTLADNRDDLVGLIKSLDGLATAFAKNDSTVREFSRNVTAATQVLAENGDNLDATIGALATALKEVGDFVRKNSTAARTGITDLTAVLTIINKHRVELTEALDVLPLTFQNLAMTVKNGRVVNNASAAANVLNPVVAQQFCDAVGPFLCSNAGRPVGTISDMWARYGTRR